MNHAELQNILTKADPAAVLVSPNVLEQVVLEAYNIRGVRWRVPHSKSIVVDRHVLFRHVEQDDLALQSHQLLPAQVILLSRPKAEGLSAKDEAALLVKYWRRLFHANIHLVMQDRLTQGLMTESVIRKRIDRIGQTEFEEIRTVLFRDGYLPSVTDDTAAYIEFAAVFLELRYFDEKLLSVFFPALRDVSAVEEVMARDLDANTLHRRTRLQGAPKARVKQTDQEYESHEYYWKLVRGADRAAEVDNRVKAAILRTRASRVAPAKLSSVTGEDAEYELDQLTKRLQAPLHYNDEQSSQLFGLLTKLLEKADQGQYPVEASILYELQMICIDHEKEIYALGPVEWVLSIGKRPICRPLPSQRMVRIIRQLRSIIDKLTIARLADAERDNLVALLRHALEEVESRIRGQFRPILAAAMEDVGLRPSNPPERTAFNKMIEEFLDRVLDAGFVTFGDLRDTISRNQLKLPDLTDPQDFIHGDPLLRLDRRLATVLDGVYRPSEIYMRWLERLTALNFGTRLGRAITRYVTVPFGGAIMLLEGIKLLVDEFVPGGHVVAEAPPAVADGYWNIIETFRHQPMALLNYTSPVYWILVGLVGIFFLTLMQSRMIRAGCWQGLKLFGIGLRRVFYDVPIRIITKPAFRQIVSSWPVQLSYWYLLKPGLLVGLLYLIFPRFFPTLLHVAGVFLITTIFLNTRTGNALSKTAYQGMLDLTNLLRAGLLGGLYMIVVTVFKQITHFVEYVLFKVDEWLRFRKGESQLSLALRTVLSIAWFPVSFLARFYVIVLIEPGINPLKFPISTIAGKILIPILLPLIPQITDQFSLIVGPILAYPIVWTTVMLTPDAFGFLFWEFKENWSLYRANRSTAVKPVPVGSHGETICGLLRPGFHSGTIPKLYTRLRQAESKAAESGNYRNVRAIRKHLQEVEERITSFVVREQISLVHQSAKWEHKPLRVGSVRLASNRIDVELLNDDFPDQSHEIEWQWRGQWLVANTRKPGWLNLISRDSYWAYLAGLTYLYKLAGVQLVEEQIQAALPASVVSYDIAPAELVVWTDKRHGNSVIYDLKSKRNELLPCEPSGKSAEDLPSIPAAKLIFDRTELSWHEMIRTWSIHGDSYRELAESAICALPAGIDGATNVEKNGDGELLETTSVIKTRNRKSIPTAEET